MRTNFKIMKYQLFFLPLLTCLFVNITHSQTVIEFVLVQKEVFVVEPRESYYAYQQGENLLLGSELEIHGGSGSYSFSWSNDGANLSNEPTFTATEEGTYFLAVNDGENCEAIAVFHVGITDLIETNNEFEIKLYPNPTKNLCYITYPLDKLPDILSIYTLEGQLIEILNQSGNRSQTYCFDASRLPSGHYLVVSDFKKSKITKVLLKQN